MKYKKTLIFISILLTLFFVIWQFKPSFIIPFIDFSILLLLSRYLWSAVKKRIKKHASKLQTLLTILFWLPLFIISVASIALLFTKLDDWPVFFKVYFIGGLFTYIVALLLPVIFIFIADIIKWSQLLIVSKKKNDKRLDKLKGEPISRKKFIVNTGLSLGGLALGTMGFGMMHGNYHFKIWRHQIAIKNLPQNISGLRIVQISDLHLGTWYSKVPLEKAVQFINNLHADLVFFTGDLVNSKTEEAFPFAQTLSKIKAKYGVFASLGNHDYGHYHKWKDETEEQKNWDDLINFYKKIGWSLLRNENKIIQIKDSKLMVIGVENWSQNPRFPQIGDLDQAIKNKEKAQVHLLLSHDPSHWDQKVIQFETPIDITFSGHTHGFQFGFESSLFRWSPAQYVYPHWAGIYQNSKQDKFLNVNRGIGAIGFPGRVGIRPEISFIELV